jgi:hypothetical protein
MAKSVTIHANQDVPWHLKRGTFFAEGLAKAGIAYRFTRSRMRDGDGVPLLLGTTFWRNIETDGGEFILVDRCSFGDTEEYIQLVFNGHGRRGEHKMPEPPDPARWRNIGCPVRAWRRNGKRTVVCGQTESYSPEYRRIEDWYAKVVPFATHFRTHPAGYNPTKLPEAPDWRDVRCAITLNSSVGVQAVLAGIPTVTFDEAAMAWPVSSHSLDDPLITPDRGNWCTWLAWTQYSDSELREGDTWQRLLA